MVKNALFQIKDPELYLMKMVFVVAVKNNENKKLIDWTKREKELIELLDKHRSKNGDFDEIVPSSGGKDSGYVAHQLKHKYNIIL